MYYVYYNSFEILMTVCQFLTVHRFAQPIDFVDGWHHLGIARASSALRSVRAAIPNS